VIEIVGTEAHYALVSSRHHPVEVVARFRDNEYRQVWALRRDSGEPVYLAEGAADARRDEAKRDWRCPVPGCEDPISTRGGTKRDHFFHLGETTGHGGHEGDMHLQAKAMLAAWVRAGGVTAVEEMSVKDRERGIDRRADVMACWPDGHQVAFEVEYKSFDPRDWRAKHDEYRSAGVPCVWLFGHLPRYLASPPKPEEWPGDEPWDRLRWRELTSAVARAGMPVLFINPIEQAVATVVEYGRQLDDVRQRQGWWRDADRVDMRFGDGLEWGDPRVVVDLLDSCSLDPVRGLVTPAMRLVDAARARVSAAAAEDEERDRRRAEERAKRQAEEAERRAARDRAPNEERVARQAWADRERGRDRHRWLSSPIRAELIGRFGTIPAYISREVVSDRGVFAHPAHWHAQLLADLTAATGRRFTFAQVYGIVGQHWKLSNTPRFRSAAINGYLAYLAEIGFVQLDFEGITLLADLDEPPQPRRAEQVLGWWPDPPTHDSPLARGEIVEPADRKVRAVPAQPPCPTCGEVHKPGKINARCVRLQIEASRRRPDAD
jgi:hypothetical protein